ncbi:MAG: glutamate racemase [Campylobacteraceae bacterium]|jgi:glutamate racemase|nr:glutamate racemase [Campylobacteraceae bacterium]MBT3882356.1 glutamate racemase [Campylobacteraceae bacterium]MBT4031240.1 glutamate racemase [Campylobacteraceae bacterium]MBT4178932.1 glutamate racemase [Campylobacteraceae bacterium]MBT4573153.1 glutamate racemase [Campylobacteraceae bacterium]
MRVGVFDSGIGGLTVVKSILEHNLFEEVIYYGDTARVPYGSKDKNTIIRYSLEALEFFKNFDIDVLIVACNTASAYALDELRANTTIPVVGVIEAGILSLENKLSNNDSNILILGTKATISSKKYEVALKSYGFNNLTSIATGLFVPIVEEQLENTQILDKTFEHYFKDLSHIDAVILGCTHFPLIEEKIGKYLGNAMTIHSGEAIVELLKLKYNCNNKFTKTDIKFFASENPDGLKDVAKKWLGELI